MNLENLIKLDVSTQAIKAAKELETLYTEHCLEAESGYLPEETQERIEELVNTIREELGIDLKTLRETYQDATSFCFHTSDPFELDCSFHIPSLCLCRNSGDILSESNHITGVKELTVALGPYTCLLYTSDAADDSKRV